MAHQAQLIPRLVFLFSEPGLAPSRIPAIISILGWQLRGHFSVQDLLRYCTQLPRARQGRADLPGTRLSPPLTTHPAALPSSAGMLQVPAERRVHVQDPGRAVGSLPRADTPAVPGIQDFPGHSRPHRLKTQGTCLLQTFQQPTVTFNLVRLHRLC